MATSIPPHNLGEVVDGLIALIRKPELSDEKLLELIPGPDFPTGGEVLISSGLRETYLHGRGSIPMRGVAHTEEVQPGKGRHKRNAVVVTELPYQLSKAGWIEKLAGPSTTEKSAELQTSAMKATAKACVWWWSCVAMQIPRRC